MASAGFLKLRELERERSSLERKMASGEKMLEGSLIERRISCGKKTCRCADGNLHGPYYYLSRKVRGKTRMIYLKDKDLIQAARAHRTFQKALTRWREVGRKIERELVKMREARIVHKVM